MERYIDIYKSHQPLQTRNLNALNQLEKIREKFSDVPDLIQNKPISIFLAGSLGRGDVGKLSDLDLFILSNEEEIDTCRLQKIEILASIININRDLGFKEFSNETSEHNSSIRCREGSVSIS